MSEKKETLTALNSGDGEIYIVKIGDCIESIASKEGLFPDTIWDNSNNSELKDVRKSKNILLPGDEVFIPNKCLKEDDCDTQQRHRFRRKGVPSVLNIVLLLENEPRANKEAIINIDGIVKEYKTDDNGRISIPIPPGAREGKILLRDGGEEFNLQLGWLDPISTISGVQGRLMNLGYELDVTGTLDKSTTEAIKKFQSNGELDVTGKLNYETKKKLEDIYSF